MEGVKWAAKNVVPVVSKVVWAVTGGSGKIGAIANAAGAIGKIIGGNAGNKIQQGAGKVGEFAGKVGDRAQKIGGVVTNKAERIKKVIGSTAQAVSTA